MNDPVRALLEALQDAYPIDGRDAGADLSAVLHGLNKRGYTLAPTELLKALETWSEEFYGPIEDYGNGVRGMVQLDHGHEESEARIDVMAAYRSRGGPP